MSDSAPRRPGELRTAAGEPTGVLCPPGTRRFRVFVYKAGRRCVGIARYVAVPDLLSGQHCRGGGGPDGQLIADRVDGRFEQSHLLGQLSIAGRRHCSPQDGGASLNLDLNSAKSTCQYRRVKRACQSARNRCVWGQRNREADFHSRKPNLLSRAGLVFSLLLVTPAEPPRRSCFRAGRGWRLMIAHAGSCRAGAGRTKTVP
jgi:hypothetical protein